MVGKSPNDFTNDLENSIMLAKLLQHTPVFCPPELQSPQFTHKPPPQMDPDISIARHKLKSPLTRHVGSGVVGFLEGRQQLQFSKEICKG